MGPVEFVGLMCFVISLLSRKTSGCFVAVFFLSLALSNTSAASVSFVPYFFVIQKMTQACGVEDPVLPSFSLYYNTSFSCFLWSIIYEGFYGTPVLNTLQNNFTLINFLLNERPASNIQHSTSNKRHCREQV
jgi:hypothetical protein